MTCHLSATSTSSVPGPPSLSNLMPRNTRVRFIELHDPDDRNFTCLAGVIRQDGTPVCRILYNRRVWNVDTDGRDPGKHWVGTVAS